MAKSSGKKKKTNQKNKANASNTAREIGAVVLAVFAVWCFVSAIGKGGSVGAVFSGFLFGIFGFGAYLFPFLLLFVAVSYVMSKNKGSYLLQGFCIFFFFLGLLFLLQLLGGEYLELGGIKEYYAFGKENRAGGGVIGGLLEKLIYPSLGSIISYVIACILMLISLMIMTGRSLAQELRNGHEEFKKVSDSGKKKWKSTMESMGEEREMRMNRRAERMEKKREEKELRMDKKKQGVTFATDLAASTKTSRPAEEMTELTYAEPSSGHTDQVSSSLAQAMNQGYFANTTVESMHRFKAETPQEPAVNSSVHEVISEPEPVRPTVSEPVKKEKLSAAEKEASTKDFAAQAEKNTVIPSDYKMPPLDLLTKGKSKTGSASQSRQIAQIRSKLEQTLMSFGVDAQVWKWDLPLPDMNLNPEPA